MVMKANKKKPAMVMKAVKKEPAVKKKPAVNKKKPAINQMASCYCTIAEAHRDGNTSTKQNPTMWMEFREKVAWLAGELFYSGTCIGGSGRIIKHKAGGLTICRTGLRQAQQGWSVDNHDLMARHTHHNYIRTEDNGKQYSGFISAKVTSIAPGTLFQARKIDPGIGSMSERPPCSTTGEVAPPRTVVTKDGDIICTFKVREFNGNRKSVTVHLMRLMFVTQGFIQDSLHADSLCDTIFQMDQLLAA